MPRQHETEESNSHESQTGSVGNVDEPSKERASVAQRPRIFRNLRKLLSNESSVWLMVVFNGLLALFTFRLWQATNGLWTEAHEQLGVMHGQLKQMRSSSVQAKRAANASARIADATSKSVIASNMLVAATAEAVTASKRLADETADAVAVSKRLVAAAEGANRTSAELAESAARSNQISHKALMVTQRPFMIPLSVNISKLYPSDLGLGFLGQTLQVPPDKPIEWNTNVEWENSGNTPTKDLTITTYCLFSRDALNQPYNVTKTRHFHPSKVAGVFVTSNNVQILYGTEQKLIFGPKQTNTAGACLRNGLEVELNLLMPTGLAYHQYVFGTARYRDWIEGKQLYRTDFCFEVFLKGNPEADWTKPNTGGKHPSWPDELKSMGVLCAGHNCADGECEAQDHRAPASVPKKPRQVP